MIILVTFHSVVEIPLVLSVSEGFSSQGRKSSYTGVFLRRFGLDLRLFFYTV